MGKQKRAKALRRAERRDEWATVPCPIPGTRALVHPGRGHRVLIGLEDHDGVEMIHLSISHPAKLPDWYDLVRAKNELLGQEVEAYLVVPKVSEYVNLHDNCHHLWARADGRPMR